MGDARHGWVVGFSLCLGAAGGVAGGWLIFALGFLAGLGTGAGVDGLALAVEGRGWGAGEVDGVMDCRADRRAARSGLERRRSRSWPRRVVAGGVSCSTDSPLQILRRVSTCFLFSLISCSNWKPGWPKEQRRSRNLWSLRISLLMRQSMATQGRFCLGSRSELRMVWE